jgi:hypothetical protein
MVFTITATGQLVTAYWYIIRKPGNTYFKYEHGRLADPHPFPPSILRIAMIPITAGLSSEVIRL